jgi:glycosyltransferase involved in cell wall biosynthesis
MRGGVQDHVLMLAKGIARYGHEVFVLTTARYDGITQESINGVQIEYLSNTNPEKNDRLWRTQSIQRIVALNDQKTFHILHSQGADSLHILSKAVHHRLSIPTVVSFHGTSWDLFKTVLLNGFSWNLIRSIKSLITIFYLTYQYATREFFFVRRAATLIATSNEQAIIYKHLYCISEKKIARIYNGIDNILFQPGDSNSSLRSTLSISSDAPIILCVARLIFAKGVQYTIQALQNIFEHIPSAILIIIGQGNYQSVLEKLVDHLGLRNNVRFVGSVPLELLPEYFRLCDVFVNATHQQNGYDLTMAEAMACGKVVIASNIGSTPTLISHGVDGLLFKTGDIAQLSSAIVEILMDTNKRLQIGKRARQKILHHFTQETMVNDTIALYEQLCDPKRSSQKVI